MARLVLCVIGMAATTAAQSAVAADPAGTFTDVFHFKGKVVCDFKFTPDGERLLAAEKRGRFKIHHPASAIEAGDRAGELYLDLNRDHPLGVHSDQETGLLGFAFAPNFAQNPYVYAYWSPLTPQRYRVSRFTHIENEGGTTSRADVASEVVLWEDTEGYLGCCHYGGGMVFGLDGYLYFGTGDKFTGASITQNVTSGGGKLHRINPDGSIPASNMGMDDGVGGEMIDSMYAIGLRNPYAIVLEPDTGRLLIADVGGNDQGMAWEEVHIGRERVNYGWPMCEGSCAGIAAETDYPQCDCALYDNPVYSYPHNSIYGGPSGKGAGIIGGFVFRGGWPGFAKEHPLPNSYLGKYLFSDYALRTAFAVNLAEDGVNMDYPTFPVAVPAVLPTAQDSSPAAITEGPDGSFWYSNSWGQIRRVQFISGNIPPVIDTIGASTLTGRPPLDVSFTSVVSDADNDTITYQWTVRNILSGAVEEVGTAPSLLQTFTERGTFTVTLRVADSGGHTVLSAEIMVGDAPLAQIASPADRSLFRAEQTIVFAAVVEEDVSYVWTLEMK